MCAHALDASRVAFICVCVCVCVCVSVCLCVCVCECVFLYEGVEKLCSLHDTGTCSTRTFCAPCQSFCTASNLVHRQSNFSLLRLTCVEVRTSRLTRPAPDPVQLSADRPGLRHVTQATRDVPSVKQPSQSRLNTKKTQCTRGARCNAPDWPACSVDTRGSIGHWATTYAQCHVPFGHRSTRLPCGTRALGIGPPPVPS